MKNRFEIRGNYVVILLDRKDGSVIETIIDKNDLSRAQEYPGKWYAGWDKTVRSYYVMGHSRENNVKCVLLHRWILNCQNGLQVDHINHDTLNNSRENIRIVTAIKNQQNCRIRKDNKSGISGVWWNERHKKWQATITLNKKQTYLGLYEDINEAAKIVKNARINCKWGKLA